MPLLLILAGAGALGVTTGFVAGKGLEGTSRLVMFGAIAAVAFVAGRALKVF
ncbi:MAG: hypothetical protein MI806_34220 [Minwuiales bacterium]|nr:hypothetical protein [Minwuiales bacterium]